MFHARVHLLNVIHSSKVAVCYFMRPFHYRRFSLPTKYCFGFIVILCCPICFLGTTTLNGLFLFEVRSINAIAVADTDD